MKYIKTAFIFTSIFIAAFVFAIYLTWKSTDLVEGIYKTPFIGQFVPAKYVPVKYILDQVTPGSGYQTKIILADVGKRMVDAGVISIERMNDLYKDRGGIPQDMRDVFENSSNKPILVTQENSSWLINILWPLGLANKMKINEKSQVAGENVNNYASTGGWTLGKEENGGTYFNKIVLIQLTSNQEERVKSIADQIYRPCCDNSSFFQDCNHGSAALALIELGVSQGLSDDEIFKTVLAFNSYWFPQHYREIALYFQKVKNQGWNRIDPRIILSKEYSSISGWIANVDNKLKKMPDLLPDLQQAGGSCSA